MTVQPPDSNWLAAWRARPCVVVLFRTTSGTDLGPADDDDDDDDDDERAELVAFFVGPVELLALEVLPTGVVEGPTVLITVRLAEPAATWPLGSRSAKMATTRTTAPMAMMPIPARRSRCWRRAC